VLFAEFVIVVLGVPLTFVNVNVVGDVIVATICAPLICVAVDGPDVPVINIKEPAPSPCGYEVVTVTIEPTKVNALVAIGNPHWL
jgi:hypothetical protein